MMIMYDIKINKIESLNNKEEVKIDDCLNKNESENSD
jgi:hypothetical protein